MLYFHSLLLNMLIRLLTYGSNAGSDAQKASEHRLYMPPEDIWYQKEIFHIGGWWEAE